MADGGTTKPARRPNVAVDLRALVPELTGIGVYTRSLLLALARRGRFEYLGLSHRPVRGADELTAAGVRLAVDPAPLGVLWQQWCLLRRLGRAVGAGGADLLWSPLATLPLNCPRPAVVTVHDLTALLFPEAHTWKVRWSLLPFLRRSLEAARAIVVPSQATAADLAFHFPESAGKTRVIVEGVEPTFRPGTDDEIARTRGELGAPDGYLLCVGTLEPRKNVGALLTAWEALRRDDEATPPLLLAGGSGWGSRSLLRRIGALTPLGVRYLGRVDDAHLIRLVQGARAFVYPSLYEGFGLPPLEAMACGVPVVVSDLSSLPEVVGDAGLTVDPRDPGALASSLKRLLADPALAADLAARARTRAATFTWDAAAAAMEEVFTAALP
jgi:glycosyltransferase involved in cell wall biosynthesis